MENNRNRVRNYRKNSKIIVKVPESISGFEQREDLVGPLDGIRLNGGPFRVISVTLMDLGRGRGCDFGRRFLVVVFFVVVVVVIVIVVLVATETET